MERAKSGDRNALEAVCRLLNGHIKNTLARTFDDPDLIEDLSQETYVRLIRGIQDITEPVKIKNFVAKMVLYVIHDHFREHYKWKGIILSSNVNDEAGYSKPIDILKENSEFLDKMTLDDIMRLVSNNTDRHLIQLRLQGKKYKEISDKLNITEAAAKMRFKRTIEYLRTQFQN